METAGHERVAGEGLTRDRPGSAPRPDGPRVGVLALQGDVAENLVMLRAAGARAVPVKRATELTGLDGILLPGGESTTIGKLAAMYGLLQPLQEAISGGLPAFGTCAGAILLARQALTHDGRASPQPLLGCMDTVVRRNAFGRQVASFEGAVEVAGIDGGPVHAAFIRAPWIEHAGPGVAVLARVATEAGAKVVVARQGSVLVSSFHPELTGDMRLHQFFLTLVRAAV